MTTLDTLRTSPNSSETIRDILRDAISSGVLATGSLHSAQSLATQLGVSRTPVREALLYLAREGAVRFERNRGVRICETTACDIQEIFELRQWIEVPAAGKAARVGVPARLAGAKDALLSMSDAAKAGNTESFWQFDREYHKHLILAASNSRAARYVDELRSRILRRGVTSLSYGRRLEDIVGPHSAILESVMAGEAREAEERMNDYLIRTKEIMLVKA